MLRLAKIMASKTTTKQGVQNFNTTKGTPKMKWYMQQDWATLKDEFFTEIDEHGVLLYRTAWNFCIKQTKGDPRLTTSPARWMWEAIGPRPTPSTGTKRLGVPWLGDWQKERAERALQKTEDRLKLLEHKYEETEQLRDSLKQVAPFAMKALKRFDQFADELDRLYAGLQPTGSVPTPAERLLIKHYLEMHGKVSHLQRQAMEQWFMAHGLHPESADSWLQLVMVSMAQEASSKGVTYAAGQLSTNSNSDTMSPAGELGDEDTLKWIVAAARMTHNKCEDFDLELPKAVIVPGDPNDIEDVDTSKKKKTRGDVQ